jgi:CubicO group peptidase (beta-lactamase class C family)
MAKFFTPLLLALALFGASALAVDVANCGTPAALDDGWTIARPEASGFDPTRLCELDDFLAQWPARNIHAVVVVRHGKLVMERYFKGADERWGRPLGVVEYGPEVKHDLRSISKSVVSLLVGIASGEGKFPDLDSPVFGQFPEFAALKTAGKAEITLRQLLTMSSGLAWDEARPYSDPANSERRLIDAVDPVRYVLEQPMAALPGEFYNYNGGGTTLLAAVLTKSTGHSLVDYAREKLFGPLGITDFEWIDMPASGLPAAASGLRLRPRDTAKLGQLLLADGAWNGKQVLPKGWAAESIKPRINGDGLYFYGYQWWLGRSMLRGRNLLWTAGVGYGGQRLFIQPDLDLVVMVNAGHYASPLQGVIPLAVFNRWVLPATYD